MKRYDKQLVTKRNAAKFGFTHLFEKSDELQDIYSQIEALNASNRDSSDLTDLYIILNESLQNELDNVPSHFIIDL